MLDCQVVSNQISNDIDVLFCCHTSVLEIFRFYDEYDNEYQIFFILSSARPWTSVILAGKRGSRTSFYYEFLRECRINGNKLSNVNSFDMLPSGEGLASTNKDNRANFSGEKSTVKHSFNSDYFLTIRYLAESLAPPC